MKKFLFFTMLLVLTISFKWSYSQVDSKNWPKAKIDYFQQPKLLISANVTPVIGFPYTGIFYGVDANLKLAKILYLNGGFLAPILDMSYIYGGEKNYSFYGGGELVLRSKKPFDRFDLTISSSQSGNVVTTRYRDYYVKVSEPTVLRFGAEYYTNSRFSPNFLNRKQGFKIETNVGLEMPDGSIYFDHSSTYNCLFFYLGIGKKSLNYFTIKMPDYQESDKFTSTLTAYFDLFYAPFLTFTPFTYRNNTYDPADFYRIMPFGGRFGFEFFKTSGKYIGFYTKIEFGMMPGVGFPAYGKLSIGISSIFTKLKSIGNELK